MKAINNPPTSQQNIYLTVPILPGQTEAWRRFVQELQGPWRKEWAEWRLRVGLHELQFHLQTSSQQSVVLLQARTDQQAEHKPAFVEQNVPFDRWLSQQLRLLHGIDLAQLCQHTNLSQLMRDI